MQIIPLYPCGNTRNYRPERSAGRRQSPQSLYWSQVQNHPEITTKLYLGEHMGVLYKHVAERGRKEMRGGKKCRKPVFLPGFEPGTFRVLGECDNHYTTETCRCSS